MTKTHHHHPRQRYVYVGHRDKFREIRVEDGRLFVELLSGATVPADSAFTQTEYVRANGRPKVLNRTLDARAARLPHYLASEFDVVFAIDTNTKPIGRETVSVATVVEALPRATSPTRVVVLHRPLVTLAFKNCHVVPPERFAWWKFLRFVETRMGDVIKQRIGIITDHDLRNHKSYNDATAPIGGDVYLPDNVTLLYASADTGREGITNALIRQCDREAARVFRGLERFGLATVDGREMRLEQLPDLRAR